MYAPPEYWRRLHDSIFLRKIVVAGIKLAAQTNWDMVRQDSGTDGVEELAMEYAEQAIDEMFKKYDIL